MSNPPVVPPVTVIRELHERIAAQVGRVVVGQSDVIRKLCAALIAG